MLPKVIIAIDDIDYNKDVVERAIDYGFGVKIGHPVVPYIDSWLLDTISDDGVFFFLDMKFYDIPSIIDKAFMSYYRKYRPNLISIHASGGCDMMCGVSDLQVENEIEACAVTVLTSVGVENSEASQNDMLNNIVHLASQAYDSGIRNIVCSAHEVEYLKKEISHDIKCITPGIIIDSDIRHDQCRVESLENALITSDSIVIGRAIFSSLQPLSVLDYIYNEELRLC